MERQTDRRKCSKPTNTEIHRQTNTPKDVLTDIYEYISVSIVHSETDSKESRYKDKYI